MNLSDKIEEIRQKPEHEKIRYVWGMVAISMIVIVSIWVVSFKSMFRGVQQTNRGSDVLNGLEKIEEKSVESIDASDSQNEGGNNLENTNK